jgi:maltooligosyltrehalose trehalohydrolase
VEARKKRFGASSAGIPGSKFVVFNQNHDQIGNKGQGERLSTSLDFERLKITAGAVILSPYIPMLFMGEEYGEKNPFSYFINHGDPQLIRAVKDGRRKEFGTFMDKEDVSAPEDPDVFERSKLNWDKRTIGKHAMILDWYKKLIKLRFSDPVFSNFNKKDIQVNVIDRLLVLQRVNEGGRDNTLCLFNFSEDETMYKIPIGFPYWKELLFHDHSPVYYQGTSVAITPWAVWILKTPEAQEEVY